jgi:hypothetical protein
MQTSILKVGYQNSGVVPRMLLFDVEVDVLILNTLWAILTPWPDPDEQKA